MILTIDLLTEQAPAISLAYETTEAAVMRRPPRNVLTERLVSGPSIFYSYVVAGGGSALVCMGCYFLVYTRAGIPISQLAFSLDQGYFAAPPFTATATPGVYTAANGNIVPILVAQSNGRRLDAYDQWCVARSGGRGPSARVYLRALSIPPPAGRFTARAARRGI
jgi:magnesium-transporting ATPase (P-type)